MLITKAPRTSLGAHSQSNCSMHDGKNLTGIKGPASEADNLLPSVAVFTNVCSYEATSQKAFKQGSV